jgi:hypothetical protein
MTDRHTADSINDNDLDALYYRLTQARDAVALHRQGLITTAELYATVEAEHSTATHADTTLTRIRAYAQHAIDTGDTGPGPAIGRLLLQLLDEQPAPAATEATKPGLVVTIEGSPTAAGEAIRQMDADTTEPHTGLVVQPYRDHGEQKWVFRCWGTDTCDGYLSLDHQSQQSAERARDRHVAEDHSTPPAPCPACARAGQAGLAPTEQHPDCRTQEQR